MPDIHVHRRIPRISRLNSKSKERKGETLPSTVRCVAPACRTLIAGIGFHFSGNSSAAYIFCCWRVYLLLRNIYSQICGIYLVLLWDVYFAEAHKSTYIVLGAYFASHRVGIKLLAPVGALYPSPPRDFQSIQSTNSNTLLHPSIHGFFVGHLF